jgi:hypothetical protein
LLSVRRTRDLASFFRGRQITAFDEKRWAVLTAEHGQESRTTHSAVSSAADFKQLAMDTISNLKVLRIELIVRKVLGYIIGVTASDGRRQTDGCETISFNASLSLACAGRVKVKANKQRGMVLVSNGYAIG